MHKIYCTYKTQNRDGYFYIGRGKYKEVICGLYTGSGTFYKEFRRINPVGWSTEVLEGPLTLIEAKAAEAKLVNADLVCQELCLNLRIMAKGKCEANSVYERFQRLCTEYHKQLAISKAYNLRCEEAQMEGESTDSIGLLTFEESNRFLRDAHLPYAAYHIAFLDDGETFVPEEYKPRAEKRKARNAIFAANWNEFLKNNFPEVYNQTDEELIASMKLPEEERFKIWTRNTNIIKSSYEIFEKEQA